MDQEIPQMRTKKAIAKDDLKENLRKLENLLQMASYPRVFSKNNYTPKFLKFLLYCKLLPSDVVLYMFN